MLMKFKRLISVALTMIMVFSLFSSNVVQAASVETEAENRSMTIRTELGSFRCSVFSCGLRWCSRYSG